MPMTPLEATRAKLEREASLLLGELEDVNVRLLSGFERVVVNRATLEAEWRPLTAARVKELGKAADGLLKLLNKILPNLTKVEASEAAQEAVRAVVLDAEYENLDERHKLVLATKLLRVVREAGDVESLAKTSENPSNDGAER